MRNKVFGGIGALWGGAILANWALGGTSGGGSAAYQSGQSGAVVFGAIMFAVGVYYLIKKPG